MKTSRILFTVAIVAFIAGFWTACSIDPIADGSEFSCLDDTDCIAPYRCQGGVCTRGGGGCVDNDGDGYGVGEDRGDCPKCRDFGDCAEDCNDNDETINPGLLDTCDGKDNNCDGQIDEPIPCEDIIDCPDEPPHLVSCEGNVCVYRTPLQTEMGCDANPVACVNGEREQRPEQCF